MITKIIQVLMIIVSIGISCGYTNRPLLSAETQIPSKSATAQETVLFNRFIGEWHGKGELFGNEAEFTMKWEWVLEKKFVRLNFQNEMHSSNGARRIFKAQAFYQITDTKGIQGTWFDSRGVVLPLNASIEGFTLTTLWGSSETEQGKTVYLLKDEDVIKVEDLVFKDGNWKPFGHAIYHRIK